MLNDRRQHCNIRHPHNGNCTCIGGFCTAVSDEICAGLQNAYEAGRRAEKKKFSHLKMTEYELEYAPSCVVFKIALWNDLITTEAEVKASIEAGDDECNPKFLVLNKAQWDHIFGTTMEDKL